MKFSVLVVDDHAAWRERVCLEVQKSGRWQVLGEAADGLEAVRQAQALVPDLILLDIGLPSLNGLEAARQIIAGNPTSRILFLSEHRSWHVVEAAIATGARGYLCKTEGAGALVPAMDAVMEGVGVVSAGLGGEVVEKTLCEDVLPTGLNRHVAAFYADEASLLEDYSRFAQRALSAGSVFVLLGDASRRAQLNERLQGCGVARDRLEREGRFIFVDFARTFPESVASGEIDEAAVGEVAAALFRQAEKAATGDRPRVALCGEAAPCLWTRGHAEAAICIERLWNQLARTWIVDSLCAYSADVLPGHGGGGEALQRICAEHSAVHFRRNGGG